jgi:multiple sugar transport system permease protein
MALLSSERDVARPASGIPLFASERVRETLAGWLFVLPALIGFLVFYLYPAIRAVEISFTDWNLLRAPKWVGFANYLRLLGDAKFWDSIRITAIYVVVNIPLQIVIGLTIAVLMDRLVRSVLFRAVVITPFLVSNVTAAMLFLWLLDPVLGVSNAIIKLFGFGAVPFFTSPDFAIYSVVLVNVWRHVGFTALLFYAGVQAIPHSLYEAARIDGASEFTVFRAVTLPLLRPVMVFVLVTNVIGSFQIFDTVAVATKGGPADATNVLLYYIYNTAFSFSRMGYASSMSVVLFLGLIVFTLFQLRLMRAGQSDLE